MSFLAACWRQIWITVVVGLLLTALYTSLGRQLIPLVETRHADIEQLLTEQLQQPVTIGRVQGGWRYVTPVLRLDNVQIGVTGSDLNIRRLQLELDVARTLYYRLPVFSRVDVDGVRGTFRRQDHQWFIGEKWLLTASSAPADPEPEVAAPSDPDAKPMWARILERQDRISLHDWRIDVEGSPGIIDQVRIDSLLWRHQGKRTGLTGKLAYGNGVESSAIHLDTVLGGPLWPWKQQSAQAYLELEPVSLLRWIPDDLPMGLHMQDLAASGKVWLQLQNGQLDSLYADLGVDRLQMTTRAEPLSITNGRIRLGGMHNGSDWHVRVWPELGEQVPLNDVTISRVVLENTSGWQFGVPQLAVEDVLKYLLDHALLPAPFDRYLSNIAPVGGADDIRVSLLPGDTPVVDVRARLTGVSSQPYNGIPGFTGVDADLHLQPFQGVVDVYHQPSVVMNLAGVYNEPWQLDDVSARVQWDIGTDQSRLWVTGIQARSGHLDVRAELAMHFPSSRFPNRESLFSLLLGVPKATVADRQRLVPDLVEKDVRDWLAYSLQEGELSNGVFLLNGNLAQNHPKNALTTQLYLDVDKARLRYLDGWPQVSDIKGNLLLDTPELDIHLDQATTLGGKLVEGTGTVSLQPDARNQTQLAVSGQLQGGFREGLSYFTTTPLQKLVNNAFDKWSGSGALLTNFRLNMGLGQKGSEPKVQLESRIRNGELTLGELGLTFSQLDGSIGFDSLKGLSSKDMRGQIMGGPFNASISSKVLSGGFSSKIEATGSATMDAYKRWQPTFLLDPVSGGFDYKASFSINTTNSNSQFDLSSTLKGVQMDFPAPFYKDAADGEHPLTVKVKPGRETRISLEYDKHARAVLALDGKGISRGQVYLGGEEPFLPSDAGIEIRGTLEDPVNAADWWNLWQRLQPLALASSASTSAVGESVSDSASGTAPDDTNPLRRVELRLLQLQAWDMPVGETVLVADQSWGEWNVDIESELAKGKVILHPGNEPLDIKLEYLHLPQPEADEPGSATPVATSGDPMLARFRQRLETDILRDIEPATISSMDIHIDEVFLGGWNLGAWTLKSRPQADGLHLLIEDGRMKGMNFTGDLYWVVDDWGHNTRLENFQVKGSDLGSVQKAFRQSVLVDGKTWRSALNMQWMGSPLAFNTWSLDGIASVRIENGSWKTEGTGALRAFGVLNFNSISRRLQLDFSDLYQSGVAFDVTKAKVEIHNGLLNFTEPLVIDGPGAKFLASGTSNLNDQSLDLKLAVTFPVTGSLPVVAVLTGFAAPIAGAIYVTQKLIGDELEKFTSASYDVRGTWSNPDLKIRQAFDNDVDGKQSRGFKDRFMSIFGMEESK